MSQKVLSSFSSFLLKWRQKSLSKLVQQPQWKQAALVLLAVIFLLYLSSACEESTLLSIVTQQLHVPVWSLFATMVLVKQSCSHVLGTPRGGSRRVQPGLQFCRPLKVLLCTLHLTSLWKDHEPWWKIRASFLQPFSLPPDSDLVGLKWNLVASWLGMWRVVASDSQEIWEGGFHMLFSGVQCKSLRMWCCPVYTHHTKGPLGLHPEILRRLCRVEHQIQVYSRHLSIVISVDLKVWSYLNNAPFPPSNSLWLELLDSSDY